MRTAIDTNILSAVFIGEPLARSITSRLQALAANSTFVASPVVFAELSAANGMSPLRAMNFLEQWDVTVHWVLAEATWSLVADRYAQYAERRRRAGGGEAKRLLADFLVGAHALATGAQLYTLDKRRYQTDFPDLRLISE